MPKTPFFEIQPEDINANPFKMIGKDWMLVCAGKKNSYNMMTASWGGLGVLWNKNVCFCFVRPTRYTYQFIEKSNYFTLSFFEEKYKDILNFCGTNSGKSMDKMNIKGLKAVETDLGNIYFSQAKLVMECRKIYFDDIKPGNFIDEKIDLNYPKKDYHRIYVGEVIKCYKNNLVESAI